MGAAPLRYGVITDGEAFAGWQRRCLERLGAHAEASFWWSRSAAARTRDVPRELLALPAARRVHGTAARLAPEELASLRAQRLDFLLALGSAPLPPELLDAARDGLWSFRHGGEPAGFWEVLRGEAVTEVALQRLSRDGLASELRRAVLRTVSWSARRNRDAVLRLCEAWPAEVARELAAGRSPGAPARPRVAVSSERPGMRQRCAQLLRAAPRGLRELARRLLYVDLWNAGLVHAPIHSFLRPGYVPEVRWLPTAGRGRLSADPFALEHEGRLWMLYEALEFAEGRGYLVAREFDAQGFGAERSVLRTPFHLSYPFLLRHAGESYCVPESCAAGEVALYRAVRFPDEWQKVATLLAGFRGVDSTLVFWNERWWCFTSEKGDAHGSKLQLFHADELHGPWLPHPRNPVKIDVRSARGAGTPFVHEGALYRPSQDYSVKLEGRITLNRVVTLDRERFEEQPVATVGPFAATPFPDKFHTLSALGEWTLVDGCREVCILGDPQLFLFKLKRALTQLGARLSHHSPRASGTPPARE